MQVLVAEADLRSGGGATCSAAQLGGPGLLLGSTLLCQRGALGLLALLQDRGALGLGLAVLVRQRGALGLGLAALLCQRGALGRAALLHYQRRVLNFAALLCGQVISLQHTYTSC